MKVRYQDPEEELDHSFNWTNELAQDEEVSTSTWSVPAPLTQPQDATFGATITTVWLADGVLGSDYYVTNNVVTNMGRRFVRSMMIRFRKQVV